MPAVPRPPARRSIARFAIASVPRFAAAVRVASAARFALAALCAVAPAAPALAQTVADPAALPRQIRVIVPQAPGGSVDLVSRMMVERLGKMLDTVFFVENRPGAGGTIGVEAAARAAPDGTTLLVASTNSHAMAPHIVPNVPFDALRDFTPIANVVYTTKVLLVSPATPYRTLAELVAAARANPRTLNYASAGVGASNHLDVEVFAAGAGIELVHVPYKGAAAGMTALASGEVQLTTVTVTTALGPVQAGKARPLAILGDRRSPLLPGVPTAAEAGAPGIDVGTWIGLMGPAGMSAAQIERLNAAVNRILRSPEAREWFDQRGLEPAPGSASDFDRVLRADYARWGAVVRRLGVQAQ
jgi:tripartite-type tricarboxylate transporter receptor subunit TctC